MGLETYHLPCNFCWKVSCDAEWIDAELFFALLNDCARRLLTNLHVSKTFLQSIVSVLLIWNKVNIEMQMIKFVFFFLNSSSLCKLALCGHCKSISVLAFQSSNLQSSPGCNQFYISPILLELMSSLLGAILINLSRGTRKQLRSKLFFLCSCSPSLPIVFQSSSVISPRSTVYFTAKTFLFWLCMTWDVAAKIKTNQPNKTTGNFPAWLFSLLPSLSLNSSHVCIESWKQTNSSKVITESYADSKIIVIFQFFLLPFT